MTLSKTDTPAATGQQPMTASAIFWTMVTVALWGGTPVAIRYSLETLPPVHVAGLRFVFAAVFMLGWCRFEGCDLKLVTGQTKPVIITGVLLFAQISMFHWGIALSNSSHATVFINTFIFWVAIIEHSILRTQRLSWLNFSGLFIAALGVGAVLITTQPVEEVVQYDVASLRGDILLLLSGFVLGVKIVYTKIAVRTVEPGKLIFWHDIVGVILFYGCSFLFETQPALKDFTLPAMLGILYHGVVVSGFCFAVQAWLLKRHAASHVSVYSFATPLFGIALAVMFRGDPLSDWLLIAGACVALGIYLVQWSR
ncbi:MAG: DMT family transporter [Planctomycetota bacterium]|nr:DMT family transporter [Planctomycetota bacterium]MDA1211252.1 DMT family transporter [Planctomycetota bacterium]